MISLVLLCEFLFRLSRCDFSSKSMIGIEFGSAVLIKFWRNFLTVALPKAQ